VRTEWERYYRRLVELRAYLLNQKSGLAKDAAEERPTYSMHMADAGTAEFDRDLALGVISSEQDALYEIDQALNRIQHGAYGVCELTGKPIEPKRLEAIPWTRFSASAEKQLEKDGGVPLARLGPRQEIPKRTAAEAQAEEEEVEQEEQVPSDRSAVRLPN
jgi:RNA polymerase-binding transcription factor DksA